MTDRWATDSSPTPFTAQVAKGAESSCSALRPRFHHQLGEATHPAYRCRTAMS